MLRKSRWLGVETRTKNGRMGLWGTRSRQNCSDQLATSVREHDASAETPRTAEGASGRTSIYNSRDEGSHCPAKRLYGRACTLRLATLDTPRILSISAAFIGVGGPRKGMPVGGNPKDNALLKHTKGDQP